MREYYNVGSSSHHYHDNNSQMTSMLIKDKTSGFEVPEFSKDAAQCNNLTNAVSARNNRDSRDDNLRIMRQSN